MRSKILLFFFQTIPFLALAQVENNTASTNKYSALTIPKSLINPQATAVMREYSEVFMMQSVDKITTHIHFIVTVLKKEGEKHARFLSYYDKLRKVSNITGKLYGTAGNVVKKLKSSDIQDIGLSSDINFADDNRVKAAEFNYGQFPYTVEFDYDIEATGSIGKELWQPQDSESLSVENAYYELQIPENEKLSYKAFNLENEKPIISKHIINTQEYSVKTQVFDVYKWTASNLIAQNKRTYTYPKKYDLPTLIVVFEHFKYGGYEATAHTWENYGKFFLKLNEGRDKLPDAFKSELKQMVNDCPTPLSKVEKLYDYLQKNTRYVSIQFGIGGFQPFPAMDVCTKKYGDCKGLTNFMYAMLKEVGVLSYYTLVGAGNDHKPLEKDLVGDYFNHVFLCVPIEKDTIWLECTSQSNPIGYCGSFTGDRDVLLITPEGGKVVHTPQYKEKENLENRKAQLTLDAEGNVLAKIQTHYSGLKQEMPNALANHNNTKDVQDFYYRRLQLPNFNIRSIKFEVEKKRIPSVSENLELSISQYAAKSGKRLFLQPNLLNKLNYNIPDTSDYMLQSKEIVASNTAFTETDALEWLIPEGYSLEHAPEPINLESTFGTYKAQISVKDNKLVYNRNLVVNKELHACQAMIEMLTFFQNIEKADKMKVVLVKKD